MDYLKELCEDLNLDTNLKKSELGFYLLPLTDSLAIEVKPLEPGVFFTSPICPCPEAKREEFFIQLMKANLFGQGTMGSTISLKDDENLLTLSRAMPYDMNYGVFKDALEDFANIVEYWREETLRHEEQAKGGIL
ncbi:MAG: type III secretion system chaperone [Simkaniaceae bacterium]|nr:type III secretion system chaperone [Candidatus Sacchlamyda saccharinae]